MRLINFALIIMLGFSGMSLGRPISKDHSSAYDFLTSTDFECHILSKHLIKAGLITRNVNITGRKEGCFVRYNCQPLPGVEGVQSFTGFLTTPSKDGVCDDVLEAAEIVKRKKENPGSSVVAKLDYASYVKSATNKFNDECWTDIIGSNKKSTAYQFYDQNKIVEQVCTQSFSCKNNAKGSIAACAPVNEAAKDQNGRPYNKIVCPQLNDCINNGFQLPAAYTEKELSQMPAYQRDKILKEISAPINVSSIENKNTGTQPRRTDTGTIQRSSARQVSR